MVTVGAETSSLRVREVRKSFRPPGNDAAPRLALDSVSLSIAAGELVATIGPSGERGLVFQDPNLFPWLTVRRNIEAGLVARGVLQEKKDDVQKFMELVGLDGFADAYPHHLSGGMAQRVALER